MSRPWTPFPEPRLGENLAVSTARNTPRRPVAEGDHQARFGAHRDKNDRCIDEIGISLVALHCLVALVARKHTDKPTMTRAELTALLVEEEGLQVRGELRELEGKRLVKDAHKSGNAGAWHATAEGERRVRLWAQSGKATAAE